MLTDFVIKNEKAKFWITVILDVLIIGALIFFALTIKGEYQKGYDAAVKNACALCGYWQIPNISETVAQALNHSK